MDIATVTRHFLEQLGPGGRLTLFLTYLTLTLDMDFYGFFVVVVVEGYKNIATP